MFNRVVPGNIGAPFVPPLVPGLGFSGFAGGCSSCAAPLPVASCVPAPIVSEVECTDVCVPTKPDYCAFVVFLESQGCRREQLTVDELNTTLVTLSSLAAGTTGTVIQICAPAGQFISIMGTQQVCRGADARTAHALRIRLCNSVDTEISLNTKIIILKQKPSGATIMLARVFYADVSLTKNTGTLTDVQFKTDPEWYRFKQGIILNGDECLVVQAVNPNISIAASCIKFALDLDLWTCNNFIFCG